MSAADRAVPTVRVPTLDPWEGDPDVVVETEESASVFENGVFVARIEVVA